MTSFLYSYTEELSEKWNEIELLINRAKESQDDDMQFHEVLCRSITVLIVAQLEGFTKGVLKSVINDLNRNLDFEQLSEPIKRTYCKKYIPFIEGLDAKTHNKRIIKLIEKFNEVNCNITYEPFFISKNKNPSPYLVRTIFENLGVKDIFNCLNQSIYDSVFENTRSELITTLTRLREQALEESKNFPYAYIDYGCKIDVLKSNGKTLWEEFLEKINQRRHSVVHGNESRNIVSINELETDKLKIQIFELASLRILMRYIFN